MVKPIQLEREIPPISPIFARKEHIPPKKDQTPISTLSKAKGSPPRYEPSKPVLERPLPAWEVLRQVGRMETIANRFSIGQEKRIDSDLEKIQNFYRDEAKKLEETYEASKEVTFWGILQDLGTMLMGAVSFFFGGAALAGGGAAVGGVLIASGIVSIGSIAFKHANGWDWIAEQIARENKELKNIIVTYVPAAVGVLAAAMSFYGAYRAVGYLAAGGMQHAFSIIQTTGTLAAGLSALANGRAASHYKTANAEVSALQTMAELTRLDLENIAGDLKDFHKNQLEIEELAGKLIQETDHAIQLTQQPA